MIRCGVFFWVFMNSVWFWWIILLKVLFGRLFFVGGWNGFEGVVVVWMGVISRLVMVRERIDGMFMVGFLFD